MAPDTVRLDGHVCRRPTRQFGNEAEAKRSLELRQKQSSRMAPDKKPSDQASLARVRRYLQNKAYHQSLLVPWRQFARAVADYVDWCLYCLWVRTTLEAENRLSPELESTIRAKASGFLEQPQVRNLKGPRASIRFWLQLVKWMERRHFVEAERQGWIEALRWYAARQSPLQKAWSFWHDQERRLQAGARESVHILSYREWKSAIAGFPELLEPGHPLEQAHRMVAQLSPEFVFLTVGRYVDLSMLVLWVRAIEGATENVPPLVQETIRHRWPDCDVPPQASQDVAFWRPLLNWVERTFFPEAVTEDWLPALQIFAGEHLHYQRAEAYCVYCQERWTDHPPDRHPTFEEWLADVDTYTEPSR